MKFCCALLILVNAINVAAESDVRGASCGVAGAIVDQSGAPLSGVELEVIVTELVDLQPVRSRTNIIVDASFSLNFPVVAELDIIARKNGYIESAAHLSRLELNADDVIIRLVSAPSTARLVQVKGVDLWVNYEGRGAGVDLESGTIVPLSDNPDLFIDLPDGWVATNNVPPSVLRMHIREGGGLYSINETMDKYVQHDIAEYIEAPDVGYKANVDLRLGGSSLPMLYFRTPSGKYGKLQVRVLHAIHRDRMAIARLEYFLQPDGTRNLNNKERLKLIRAKQGAPIHQPSGLDLESR